ncbi:MAG TPA: DUF177 domain-containing protein [Acidimicrobiales bacterium]
MTSTTRSPLRIGITELRRRPGTQREVEVSVSVPDLAITTARVPEGAEVHVEAVVEAVEGGITAVGRVEAPWEGECRRCLELVTGSLDVELHEVFEPNPTDGETYPIEGDEVDLEPVVRDALLLHLPLAPLCREDCAGPAPETFPTSVEGEGDDDEGERPPDPRWAALDELKLEP